MEEKGVLLVLRRPDENNPIESTEYIPCIYCLGFVQKTQAYRHVKNCHFNKNQFGNVDSTRIVDQGKSLLLKMTYPDDSNDNWQNIKKNI